MSRVISYITEELAWIEANKDWPRRRLHSAFCFQFGRKDVSEVNLTSLCKRKGWLTGRTGCFPPGRAPMNKGKKMPFNAASARTWFQKGQRPLNKHDVGYESVSRDGYVMICVAEPNPWTGAATHMVPKHRRVWEAANGPVPAGMRLKCLDGDKTNTEPSNWEAIPIALAPRLNGRFGRGYDAADPELKPLIMAITKLEHAARTARKPKLLALPKPGAM